MYNDITRITKGLEILEKYKPDANIYGSSNATYFLSTQEEEFVHITKEDKEELIKYGWWQRDGAPYFWYLR